ncbi:MAG: hypothetical protein KGJ06_05690, partial [Pseudomonadota bacterium]|nr:hypothetical protein [Pseudomonadota bacterium]
YVLCLCAKQAPSAAVILLVSRYFTLIYPSDGNVGFGQRANVFFMHGIAVYLHPDDAFCRPDALRT